MQEHVQADEEEEKAGHARVEVQPAAQPTRPQRDLLLHQPAVALEEVVHGLADGVSPQHPPGVGRRLHDQPPDTCDAIARKQASHLRSRAGHHPLDHRLLGVDVEHHAVVGPGNEHVQDREAHDEEGSRPEGQQRNEPGSAFPEHIPQEHTTCLCRDLFVRPLGHLDRDGQSV